jgi:shikimate kinase
MPQPVFPSSPAGSRPRRLTIGLQDMLVPFPGAAKKSGNGLGGAVQIATAEAGRQGATARGFAPRRTVVLVGLMGAGKSKIGGRLAARLGLPFFDSDDEIEAAAGETIEEIFANRGERMFRDGERRVIARLLAGPVHVLATGGGAFLDPATRRIIARSGVSLWLRADLDILVSRVSRRNNRPLLKTGDTRTILAELIDQRYPIYAEANVVIDSGEGSPELTVSRAIAALASCPLAAAPPEAEGAE